MMKLVKKIFSALKRVLSGNQEGEFGVGAIVGAFVGAIVVIAVIVGLWASGQASVATVTALTYTDAGTTIIKALAPIMLIVLGAGGMAGLVIWALRKFGLM